MEDLCVDNGGNSSPAITSGLPLAAAYQKTKYLMLTAVSVFIHINNQLLTF